MEFTAVNLAAMVIATGALGTAAFGIVDGMKLFMPQVATAGFKQLVGQLGEPVMAALRHAYGSRCEELLRAQYRQDRRKGDLPRTLRQGVRIGLPGADSAVLASDLPGVDADGLGRAVKAMAAGKKPADRDRPSIARFEMAIDARIDAALALAEEEYKGIARLAATAVSIGIALLVGLINARATGDLNAGIVGLSLLVGIAAVPIAPMAKDLSKAINAADKALWRRS